MPAIIVENDTSIWSDETGAVYHFPKRYKKILTFGEDVIYYKGKIKDRQFANKRLDSDAHYFGVAKIGKVYDDDSSSKGDLFALIENFRSFDKAVLAKQDGLFLEEIPENRKSNYWRDGVRTITKDVFDRILSLSSISDMPDPDIISEPEYSFSEGAVHEYIGTRYERNTKLRKQAVAIHGLTCAACGFNFEKAYGEYANGYIHIHHIFQISDFNGEKTVNPETDLVPLCANCHAVVHRKREPLTIDDLKGMVKFQFHWNSK